MPTFSDSSADAAEAAEALRGLAHATRHLDNPADTYSVVGQLMAGVRSLRQSLDQLATVHASHQGRVTDDARDHQAGSAAALAAADELHQAATFLDQAEDHLSAAHAHSGRIVWPTPPGTVERWVGVTFLQGEDADKVLDIIDEHGTDAAIDHLSGYDYGAETTQAAFANGDVHDTPPEYPLDRHAESGDYVLRYNHIAGTIALYRQHLIPAADALPDEPPQPAAAATRTGQATRDTVPPRRSAERDASWFTRPTTGAASGVRGLSL